MAESTLRIAISVIDNTARGLSAVSEKLDHLEKKIERSADASRKFGLALAAASAAGGAFGLAAIKAAADAEQTAIAFETMLGSAEDAGRFIKDLTNFAKTTPFELKGLEQSSKQLLAYGFAQEEVLPNLKALGDIAAGVGMDKLPNLILAFGQVKAATRLTGMELRQFTEAGVPMLDELAKIMKKPVSEIQAMVSEGQVGFPIVQQALQNLTAEGGRFNDLMQKQSQSLGGMWSNLSDAWDIFLRNEGAKLIDWAKQFTQGAIYLVENVLPVWIERIEALTNWFSQNKAALIVLAGAILGALTPAIIALGIALAGAAIALAPWIIGGAIIGGIIAGVLWIVKNWDMLKAKALEVWGAITSWIGEKASAMGEAIKGALEYIKSIWTTYWNFYVEFLKNVMGFIVGIPVAYLDFFFPEWEAKVRAIIDVAVAIWTSFKDWLATLWFQINELVAGALMSLKEAIIPPLQAIAAGWTYVWTAVRDFFAATWDAMKEKVGEAIDWIMDKIQPAIDLARKLIDVIKSIGKIAGKAGGATLDFLGGGIQHMITRGREVANVNDAIISPNGNIITTHPDDYLIATKNPGSLGGGPTIVIQGNTFMSDEDAAEKIGGMIISKLGLNRKFT